MFQGYLPVANLSLTLPSALVAFVDVMNYATFMLRN
jgi:hypothetical protein